MQSKMTKKIILFLAIVFTIGTVRAIAGSTVYNPLALGKTRDLTVPTEIRQYPLGYVVAINDEVNAMVNRYIYVRSSGAVTQARQIVLIDLSSTAGTEFTMAVPSTDAVDRMYGVTQTTFTASYYGFVQIQGYCTVITTDTVTVAQYGVPQDATTDAYHEASISVNTIGAFVTARTGAGSTDFVLFGREAQSD